MISDAYVLFTCDGGCGTDEEVTLPVMYSNLAGTDPHADLRDGALARSLPRKWLMVGDKTYCEDCKGREAPASAINSVKTLVVEVANHLEVTIRQAIANAGGKVVN